MVDDILLASRVDSPELQIATERVDVAELAAEVIAARRAHADERLTLELVAPPSLPAVAADRDKLRQVLTNLVANAVKYSPAGGRVAVELSARRPASRHRRSRRGPRHRDGGAESDLREVLPRRREHEPRRQRQRPRPLHLPRARPSDGRDDLGRLAARRGLDRSSSGCRSPTPTTEHLPSGAERLVAGRRVDTGFRRNRTRGAARGVTSA